MWVNKVCGKQFAARFDKFNPEKHVSFCACVIVAARSVHLFVWEGYVAVTLV